MDTKDIVIAVLVISLVFLVGLVLGQRKKRDSTQDINQSSLNVAIKSAPSQSDVTKPVTKARKDYSREFELLQKYNNRAKVILPNIYERHCYEPFDEQFVVINSAYEVYGQDKKEHSIEDVQKLFSSILTHASFGNVVSQIQKKSDTIADELLSGFKKDLDVIFKGKEYESLSDRYRLSTDLEVEQHRKISSAIAAKFNTAILKAREYEQKREWLVANYGNYQKLMSTNTDWAGGAKYFAGGAMAFANPIIGIPMLLGSWMKDSENDKQNQAFIDTYFQKWGELESMIDSLRQEVIDASKKAVEYIVIKCDEIYIQGITVILKETASAGHSIDHYFVHIMKTELPELLKFEKEFGIKGD